MTGHASLKQPKGIRVDLHDLGQQNDLKRSLELEQLACCIPSIQATTQADSRLGGGSGGGAVEKIGVVPRKLTREDYHFGGNGHPARDAEGEAEPVTAIPDRSPSSGDRCLCRIRADS
jgi:hypothetical protein